MSDKIDYSVWTEYNEFGKIARIHDSETNRSMDFLYGPDDERYCSIQRYNDGSIEHEVIYLDGLDLWVDWDGVQKWTYYPEEHVITRKVDNGNFNHYFTFTDQVGSILKVVDANGTVKFSATYDPWGRQTVTTNQIGLIRGYTGHEMLTEYGLINMNGRLYDPLLGRFLSTDNFVQEPGSTQSFNRYSYCLNNPLKYNDPDGEMAWFIPVIVGSVVGAYTGASIQSGTAAFWNWSSNCWKGAIVGGILGGALGFQVSTALWSSNSIAITGLTEKIGEATLFSKAAGITNSILQSGTINIALNLPTGGGLDGAWKSGVSGLVTGAWAATGGFGMAKGFGATTKASKMFGKLGYQAIGTVGSSIGNNWARNNHLLSNLTLGVGPVNFTIGKQVLRWENNIGNILFNSLGIANLAFGGKAIFDTDNLTFVYKGGLRDKIFGKESAWGSFAVFGNNNLYPPTESKYSDLYSHELHHLWQSRAMGEIFIPNYVAHGLTSLIGRGDFIEKMNFYEQIGYFHHWYE